MTSTTPDFHAWFPEIDGFPRPDWKMIRECDSTECLAGESRLMPGERSHESGWSVPAVAWITLMGSPSLKTFIFFPSSTRNTQMSYFNFSSNRGLAFGAFWAISRSRDITANML